MLPVLRVQVSAFNRGGDTFVFYGSEGSGADQIAAVAAAAAQPGVLAVEVEFRSGPVRRARVVNDPSFAQRRRLNDVEMSSAPHWLENDLIQPVTGPPVRRLPERTDDPVVDVGERRATGTPRPGPAEDLAAAIERRFRVENGEVVRRLPGE